MDKSSILLMIMSRGKYFQTQIEIVRMAKKNLLLLCVRMAGVSSLISTFADPFAKYGTKSMKSKQNRKERSVILSNK